jgi:hypothetical protein
VRPVRGYRAVLFAVLAAPDVVWQALHGWPNYFVLGGKGYYPGGVYTFCFAYDALPASERAVAAIVAGNYGEAGAVDRYGAALELPPVYRTTAWPSFRDYSQGAGCRALREALAAGGGVIAGDAGELGQQPGRGEDLEQRLRLP